MNGSRSRSVRTDAYDRDALDDSDFSTFDFPRLARLEVLESNEDGPPLPFAGFRIDGVNHILFHRRCPAATIKPFRLPEEEFRATLRPLAVRTGLVLVAYNLAFEGSS